MNKFTSVIGAGLLLTGQVFARESETQVRDAEGGCCRMVDMDGKMEKMQEHLREMQALLERTRQDEDPAQHGRLMEEHMALMQESVEMMEGHIEMMQMMHRMMGQEDQGAGGSEGAQAGQD